VTKPTYETRTPRPGRWPAKLSAAMISQIHVVGSPKFSPHGDRVAFVQGYDGRADIFVVPTEGGLPFQVTTDAPATWPSRNFGADFCWSPDSREIAYRAASDSKLKIVLADGGPIRSLTFGDGEHRCPSYSPNGR
jgi:hypothetical protein